MSGSRTVRSFELGGDSFLFPDYEQITSDVERLGFNLTSKFEISPSAELFFEGMYFESNGRNLVEQPRVQLRRVRQHPHRRGVLRPR